MKPIQRACITSLLVIALFPLCSFAQVDSTFKSHLNNAWTDIKENDYSDSLQNEYANQFYDYYLNNKKTKTGDEALLNAFVMWGNTGAAAQVESAIQKIGYGEPIWGKIINSIGGAYIRGGKSESEYISLMEKLSTNITDPTGKSAALMRLGDYHAGKNNFGKAKSLYTKIITINANEFFTQKARGNIREIKSLRVGFKAPDFSATTLDGNTFSLSDIESDYVILEFWATWCGPCKPEIPHLKTLHKKYDETDLKVVGISLDRDPKKWEDFVAEKQMNWIQILQEKEWQDTIPKLYNVNGIPQSYLLDKKGKIIAKDLRGKELEKKIAELLE